MKNRSRLKARGPSDINLKAVITGVTWVYDTGDSVVTLVRGIATGNPLDIIEGAIGLLDQLFSLFSDMFAAAERRRERQKKIDNLSREKLALEKENALFEREIEKLQLEMERESAEAKERDRQLTVIEQEAMEMEESLRKREERIKEREMQLEQSVKSEVREALKMEILEEKGKQLEERKKLEMLEKKRKEAEIYKKKMERIRAENERKAREIRHQQWLNQQKILQRQKELEKLEEEKKNDSCSFWFLWCWYRSRTHLTESRYTLLNEVADKNYTIRNAVKKNLERLKTLKKKYIESGNIDHALFAKVVNEFVRVSQGLRVKLVLIKNKNTRSLVGHDIHK